MNLESRLDRLEKQNRRLKIGVLVVLVLSVGLGADTAIQESVVARSFVLVDKAKKPRAILTMNKTNPEEVLFRLVGDTSSAALIAGPNGAMLSLKEGEGQIMAVTRKDGGSIAIGKGDDIIWSSDK